MKRTLDLTYDEIVIGADLSALCYSYIKKAPLLYLRKLKPNKFDPEYNKWDQIMFFLSLHNLIPFSDVLHSIRFEENNKIKVTTRESYVCSLTFNKCILSDDFNVFGIEYEEKFEARENLIIDYFKIENLNNLPDKWIYTDDHFLKK